MANPSSDLAEAQVLAALAIVATPVGAAALLSEWLERGVAADEVSRCIAASPKLQRIAKFCGQVQERDGATDLGRIGSMGGLRRWRDRRARK